MRRRWISSLKLYGVLAEYHDWRRVLILNCDVQFLDPCNPRKYHATRHEYGARIKAGETKAKKDIHVKGLAIKWALSIILRGQYNASL